MYISVIAISITDVSVRSSSLQSQERRLSVNCSSLYDFIVFAMISAPFMFLLYHMYLHLSIRYFKEMREARQGRVASIHPPIPVLVPVSSSERVCRGSQGQSIATLQNLPGPAGPAHESRERPPGARGGAIAEGRQGRRPEAPKGGQDARPQGAAMRKGAHRPNGRTARNGRAPQILPRAAESFVSAHLASVPGYSRA